MASLIFIAASSDGNLAGKRVVTMNDLVILTSATAAFMMFLMVHVIVFRLVDRAFLLCALSYIFLLVGAVIIFFEALLLRQTIPTILLMTFSIYGLLVFIYIFGILGVAESSVRIRLLHEIAKAEKGVTEKELLQSYNAKTIVRKRLHRLVSSGELIEQNGIYQINKRLSFIYIPLFITRLLWRLYGVQHPLV